MMLYYNIKNWFKQKLAPPFDYDSPPNIRPIDSCTTCYHYIPGQSNFTGKCEPYRVEVDDFTICDTFISRR